MANSNGEEDMTIETIIPFGWVHDGLLNGGLVFQRQEPDSFTKLVHSSAPVYSHAQLCEAVAAERERILSMLRRNCTESDA
jgi:hypothetical protein